MIILGLETSCDETAAALLQVTNKIFDQRPIRLWRKISNLKIQTLSNIIASQIEIHKKYGGIVPEVAARKHVESMIPVVQEALNSRNKTPAYASSPEAVLLRRTGKFQINKPDLIAVTQGPGLITSLQVGLQTAKTLSYVWQVPLVGVNHLEAHLWSYLLNQDRRSKIEDLKLPAVGLIISGGHTEMILVKVISKYQPIGRTRDDAVGEAFDKVAKMLNLGYPGGPIISHYAKEGDPNKINFPRPMMDSNDFDFSFSGIKTSVKYFLNEMIPTGSLSSHLIKDICASFQQAVIEVLAVKTIKAAVELKAKSIILGGGVSANEGLIENLRLKTKDLEIDFYYPQLEHTGDNAAMIALAGYFNYKKSSKICWQTLAAEANLKLV